MPCGNSSHTVSFEVVASARSCIIGHSWFHILAVQILQDSPTNLILLIQILPQQVFRIKEEIEDKSLQYPSYYLQPFHAYTNGNLDWTAAFENESATSAMAWRVYKDPSITPAEAQDRMRTSIFECLEVRAFSRLIQRPKSQKLWKRIAYVLCHMFTTFKAKHKHSYRFIETFCLYTLHYDRKKALLEHPCRHYSLVLTFL